MTGFRRAIVVVLTAGWLVHVCLSHWLSSEFLEVAVVPSIRGERVWIGSFDPIPVIDKLFHLSIIWLAAVLVFWSLRATSQKDR